MFKRVREVAMMFRKSLANNFLSSDTCRGFKRRSSGRANCQRWKRRRNSVRIAKGGMWKIKLKVRKYLWNLTEYPETSLAARVSLRTMVSWANRAECWYSQICAFTSMTVVIISTLTFVLSTMPELAEEIDVVLFDNETASEHGEPIHERWLCVSPCQHEECKMQNYQQLLRKSNPGGRPGSTLWESSTPSPCGSSR